MKRFRFSLTFFLFCLFLSVSFGQVSQDIDLLYHWDGKVIPDTNKLRYSDCWGLTVNGHEIAIIGGYSYSFFFDITDPSQPEEIARFRGKNTTAWREYKSYGNYLYGICDNCDEGLYTWDLSQAPDTVIVASVDSTHIRKAHMLFVDEGEGKLYLCGGNINSGVMIFDLKEDPAHPKFITQQELPIGPSKSGYVHDLYVRNNIAYNSNLYAGEVTAWDLNDPLNPVYLATFYTGGYNHNSWMDASGKYLITAIETAGQPLYVLDISKVKDGQIEKVSTFSEPLEAPDALNNIYHNAYWIGNYGVASAYEDGVTLWDLKDPENPKLAAWYDTYPDNEKVYNGFNGCWGVYAFYPSGTWIASDRNYGLFVLQPKVNLTATEDPTLEPEAQIFPNPAGNLAHLRYQPKDSQASYHLIDIQGREVRSGKLLSGVTPLSLQGLPAGLFRCMIQDGGQWKGLTIQKI